MKCLNGATLVFCIFATTFTPLLAEERAQQVVGASLIPLVDQIRAGGLEALGRVELKRDMVIVTLPDGSILSVLDWNTSDDVVATGIWTTSGKSTVLRMTDFNVVNRNRIDFAGKLVAVEVGASDQYLTASMIGRRNGDGVLSLQIGDSPGHGVSQLFDFDIKTGAVLTGSDDSEARMPQIGLALFAIAVAMVVMVLGCFLSWWCYAPVRRQPAFA